MKEKTHLIAPRFRPLHLGSVKPEGWLKNQLRIQAAGLSGNLDEFWPDIKESRWFGGAAEGWERAPYWLDGIIPLAFLLDDEKLKEKVTRYMDYIIANQREDGWLGPKPEEPARYDIWALFLALKMLVQYHDATGDKRVFGSVEKCLQKIDSRINKAPLFNWAMFRWFEVLIAIYWLYEKTGGQWLIDLAVKIYSQGFNWAGFFERWPLTDPTPSARWNFMGHVVNNAMAIKAHGLWWRLTGNEQDRVAVCDMIEKLDQYHGMVTGVFTGDECIAGRNPVQGTELCAVVEYMYSLEVLLSIFGDPAFGDRLEKITFNALPATFSPDMWAHQYDQQVNQVECSVRENRSWNTNGPDANIFGLEPHYGCCTANLSQGWPKFASHLWMLTADQGLAAVAYAPSVARVDISGVQVDARLETEYPFRDTLRFVITTERPVRFPLFLRIPEWALKANVRVEKEEPVQAQNGAFYRIEREWKDRTEILLTLPMRSCISSRYHGSIAIERGPLVYSLKIDEAWKRVHEDKQLRELPHADWEVYSTTPWNYALHVKKGTVENDVIFTEHPLGDCPFSPDGAPVSAAVRGRRLPQWHMENGSAEDLPESPLKSSEPIEQLTLIPYGCTNLRITEFPVLQ